MSAFLRCFWRGDGLVRCSGISARQGWAVRKGPRLLAAASCACSPLGSGVSVTHGLLPVAQRVRGHIEVLSGFPNGKLQRSCQLQCSILALSTSGLALLSRIEWLQSSCRCLQAASATLVTHAMWVAPGCRLRVPWAGARWEACRAAGLRCALGPLCVIGRFWAPVSPRGGLLAVDGLLLAFLWSLATAGRHPPRCNSPWSSAVAVGPSSPWACWDREPCVVFLFGLSRGFFCFFLFFFTPLSSVTLPVIRNCFTWPSDGDRGVRVECAQCPQVCGVGSD